MCIKALPFTVSKSTFYETKLQVLFLHATSSEVGTCLSHRKARPLLFGSLSTLQSVNQQFCWNFQTENFSPIFFGFSLRAQPFQGSCLSRRQAFAVLYVCCFIRLLFFLRLLFYTFAVLGAVHK